MRLLTALVQLSDWEERKEVIHGISKKSGLLTVHVGYSFSEDLNLRICPKLEDAPVQILVNQVNISCYYFQEVGRATSM